MLNCSAEPRNSTSVLKALPGKLYIKRCKTGIIFISLPISSLFKLAIYDLIIDFT